MNGADDFDEIDSCDCPECGAMPGEMHLDDCSQGEDEDHADERDLSIPRPGQ